MCEVAAAYGKQMMLLDAYYYVAANDNNPLAVSCWQTHLHTSNHFFLSHFMLLRSVEIAATAVVVAVRATSSVR